MFRYKLENIWCDTWTSEPPLLINSYLNPLVQEFLKLWEGISIEVYTSSSRIAQTMIFRAALIGVSCDIPAGRKVCGHSARLGCTRDTLMTKMTKVKRMEWILRTNDQQERVRQTAEV